MSSKVPFHTHQVELPKVRDDLTVHPLSDLHVGAEAHAKQLLQARVKRIAEADESHRVLLMGDLMDAGIKNSVGHQHGGTSPQAELEYLHKLFEPIADRIDIIFPGNHENRIWKDTGLEPLAQLATILGRPGSYRPGPAVIQYRWRRDKQPSGHARFRFSAQVFAHHGWGGGRKPGGKINKLTDLALIKPDCDVYLMGHTHENAARMDTTVLGWPAKEKRRLFVSTSSYLGSGEKYAMEQGYTPPSPGAPKVILVGRNTAEGRWVLPRVVLD